MADLQQEYDDAMYDFSMGDYDSAIAKLKSILARNPQHFDAQLSLGMAYCRKGDYAAAIAEGHKAEKLNPKDQLVHTNLSLFYMKAGNKAAAEHHGLQARIASWRGDTGTAQPSQSGDSELQMAGPEKPAPIKLPPKLAQPPWKKKPPTEPSDTSGTGTGQGTPA